jgi:5-methylcytosine-specific restriction endonuclease McrA
MPYKDIEKKHRAQAAYYRANREKNLARSRRWNRENRARATARARRYRQAHREQTRTYFREWARTHPKEAAAKTKKYRLAHPDVFRKHEARRRARMFGNGPVDLIDPGALWIRDRGYCGICGWITEYDDWEQDHIIPLSRGGTHTWGNIQVSHGRCSRRKNARLPR